MMSRREALDADLRMLERTAETKDPDGMHGNYALSVRRAGGLLWSLFCEIQQEPFRGFLWFPNRKRERLVELFDKTAWIIGFTLYRQLRGR